MNAEKKQASPAGDDIQTRTSSDGEHSSNNSDLNPSNTVENNSQREGSEEQRSILDNETTPSDPSQPDVLDGEDTPVIQRTQGSMSWTGDEQSDHSDSDIFLSRLPALDISNLSHHSSESDPDWHHWETCSNSSFSDASDSMDEDDALKDLPKALQKTKPKHKWFAVKEIIKREVYGGLLFREKYYGSLHVVQRLELMYKMDEHNGCVNAIHFDASGCRLISGSDDRSVCVWDWPRGKSISKFSTGHMSNVFQCKYLGQGMDKIVTCSRDGQVRLALTSGASWDTIHLASHTRPCHKLSTLPNSQNVFLTAAEDALVLSIDIRQPKANKLMCVKEKNQKVSLYSVHANPLTGQEICLAGEDCYVRIYDRRNISKDGQTPWKLSPVYIKNSSMCYVSCAVFNYNGTQVIGSYCDDAIYLFENWSGYETMPSPTHQYEGHRNVQTVKGVNFFGPKSEYIISGSDCGNIYIWDKETEAIVQFMRGDEDGVINCLEPHPHAPILATSGLDSDVKIWIPSCEHEPLMKGLKKTLKQNQANRERKYDSAISSSNDLVLNLWSHIQSTGLSHLLLTRNPSNLFTQTSSSSSSDSD